MTLTWTTWEDDPAADESPYIDWMRETVFYGRDTRDGLSIAPLPVSRLCSGIIDGPLAGPDMARAPLPPHARPPSPDAVLDTPDISLTWTPDPDCAIVGVIDSAIALSHERFRRIDGGSRFLSAWLMGAAWRDGSAVPFGRELFRSEIDRIMWRARRSGNIDEAEFDRLAGATDFSHPRGDRRLETRGTHGTGVADLAAGFDPRDASMDAKRRRLPMIAVGLPPRSSMGASGNFLEFFAIYAVDYIIDRADRIWNACAYGDGGFPVVINLSYGLQAGPKDGHMLIEEVIRAADRRGKERGRPVRVILPAGNDLDSEGAAVMDLGTTSSRLAWRIRPEDHTPNYAEIWSDVIAGPAPTDAVHPAAVSLSPACAPEGPVGRGRIGQRATLVDEESGCAIARIYCRHHDNVPPWSAAEADWHRISYILCTRPTLDRDCDIAAPSGQWCIDMTSEAEARVFTYVQSDQSLTFGGNTGLVSTFAHPDYQRFDATGRMVDAYDYPLDGSTPNDTDGPGPMTRFGTQNAIACLHEAAVIGSYRITDGRSTTYSGAARIPVAGDARDGPSALLPGEDGAAQFGLRAAGSRSGSTVALSGTSFSTALATRAAALAMLDWIDGGRKGEAPGTDAWFRACATADEKNAAWPGKLMPQKAGGGRIASPPRDGTRNVLKTTQTAPSSTMS